MSDSARMKQRPNQREGARAVSAGMSARGLRAPLGLVILLLAACSGAARPAGEPRAAEQRAAVSGASAPTNAAAPADSAYGKLDVLVTHVRKRNTDAYAVKSPAGIDEASFVRIGGIEQWITIRGQNRANPVLLFLHGGPGDVTSPWGYAYFAPWYTQFTVVEWDQRGAGRTLRKSGPSIAPTITVDRLVDDGIELSDYLRKHLGKEKIFIVGHSFGSTIGTLMARARPDLFFAYVGTAQVADNPRAEAFAYEALVKKAQASDNQRAKEELAQIGPPPRSSGQGYGVQRKWANQFEGADRFIYGTIGLALVGPGSTVDDFNDSADGQQLSGERLVPQTKAITAKDLGVDFALPIFVIQGVDDFTTPTELARQYVDKIKAPRKEFVVIEGAGHFAVFTKSDEFLKELVTRVRPLAQGAR